MTENTTTSLKTAAVQLDTLADPRLAAEGQSLFVKQKTAYEVTV